MASRRHADPPPSLATSSVLGPDHPAAEPGPDPHQRLSRPWARKYAYAPDRGKFGGPEHRQAAEMGVRLTGRQASGPVARKTSRLAHRRSSWMAPFRRGRLFGSSSACASSTTNTLPANPSIRRALCFVVSAAGDRYQRRGLFGTTAAEAARGQSLEQRLAEEEPDPIGGSAREPRWSDDRRERRNLAQAVSGRDGSHSRTDPDLVGPNPGRRGLSAEEAALHRSSRPPCRTPPRRPTIGGHAENVERLEDTGVGDAPRPTSLGEGWEISSRPCGWSCVGGEKDRWPWCRRLPAPTTAAVKARPH